MTARAAFTQADLDRACKVAFANGARLRVVPSDDGARADLIIEPIDTKTVDKIKGPEEW